MRRRSGQGCRCALLFVCTEMVTGTVFRSSESQATSWFLVSTPHHLVSLYPRLTCPSVFLSASHRLLALTSLSVDVHVGICRFCVYTQHAARPLYSFLTNVLRVLSISRRLSSFVLRVLTSTAAVEDFFFSRNVSIGGRLGMRGGISCLQFDATSYYSFCVRAPLFKFWMRRLRYIVGNASDFGFFVPTDARFWKGSVGVRRAPLINLIAPWIVLGNTGILCVDFSTSITDPEL